jgi:hypothetical protein
MGRNRSVRARGTGEGTSRDVSRGGEWGGRTRESPRDAEAGFGWDSSAPVEIPKESCCSCAPTRPT